MVVIRKCRLPKVRPDHRKLLGHEMKRLRDRLSKTQLERRTRRLAKRYLRSRDIVIYGLEN